METAEAKPKPKQRGNPAFQKREKYERPFKVDQQKTYEFELIQTYENYKPKDRDNGQPITSPYPKTYSRPNEGIAFDEDYDNGANQEKGRARQWRYITGQPSIWVDEQPSLENLEPRAIYKMLGEPENQLDFTNGKLLVNGIEPLKLQALMVQDKFEGKKVQLKKVNREYRLNNPDLILKEALNVYDKEYQAMKLAMEADTEEMLRASFALGIDITDQSDYGLMKIKQNFRYKAKYHASNPEGVQFFMDVMANPLTKINYVLNMGLQNGIISATQQEGKLTWAKPNSAIMDIAGRGDVVDLLAGMIMARDEKALKIFEEIDKQLNNL